MFCYNGTTFEGRSLKFITTAFSVHRAHVSINMYYKLHHNKSNKNYNTHYQLKYNFSKQNGPQNSDRVQFGLQSPERCITKHLKNTKLYSIEFLRTEMTADPQTITENTRLTASNT